MTLPVFGISRLRMASDGPGITTLVGTLGCPLQCRFCLNPQAGRPETPVRHYTVETLIERLRIDGLYFIATDGGVTFGGGEPLLHASFIAAFGQSCPAEWKLRVETCLNVPIEALDTALPALDELIVDVKDMNPEIYRAYTGQSNAPLLANLRLLAETCPDRVHLRVPRIPDFNTDSDNDRSESQLRTMGFSRIERFSYIRREA